MTHEYFPPGDEQQQDEPELRPPQDLMRDMAGIIDNPDRNPRTQYTSLGFTDGRVDYLAVGPAQSAVPITHPNTQRSGTVKAYYQPTPEHPLQELTWTTKQPNDIKYQRGDEGILPVGPEQEQIIGDLHQRVVHYRFDDEQPQQ